MLSSVKSNVVTITVNSSGGGGLGFASGGIFLPAHPLIFPYFSASVIQPWLQAYKNAGLSWVGVQFDNLTPGDSANLAFLDQTVSIAKSMGFKVVLRYEIPFRQRTTPIGTIISQALSVIPQMVSRYSPDEAVALYEVETWDSVLGISLTATQWVQYAAQLSAAFKSASPTLPVGVSDNAVSGLGSAFLNGVMQLSTVDGIGAHLYSSSVWSAFQDTTWPNAKLLGKYVFVDEGWRAAVGVSSSSFLLSNEPLDVSWFQAVVPFCIANGVRYFMPFFTNAFFFYASSSTGTDVFLADTQAACEAGQTTDTYATYKGLV